MDIHIYSIDSDSTSQTNLDYDAMLYGTTMTLILPDTLDSLEPITQCHITTGGLDFGPSLTPTSKDVQPVKSTR